jgi:hypothetical protein
METKVKNLKKSQADRLNALYVENELVDEDIHKDKRGFKLICRSGIEKIIAKKNIQIQIEMKLCNQGLSDVKDCVVVMATGKMGSTIIQTFGEANATNTSPFQKGYMVAMAEKRAKARCALMLAGFYREGYFGEEEMGDTISVNNPKK